MQDEKFVAASAIALVVTLAGIFWMRPLARRMGLVDRPSERKRHHGRIPLVGGLCFFIGTGAGLLYYAPPDRFTANLLGIGAFIVLIGLIDDLEDLSARARLLIQAGAAGLMIATTGVYVENLGPLLGQEAVHLHAFGIPLTILAVVGLVNAFNMLDGIDGLAGTIALVSITAILAYASADWPGTSGTVPLQVLGLTLVPYLLVNLGWPDGRRIFMGDAGSTLLGFVLAFSLIRLSQPGGTPLAAVDMLWCVALPVMDTLMVMYRRMLRRQSPLRADRRHLHHRLLDAGFTPRATLALIASAAVALVGVGYLLRDVPEGVSLAVFVGCLLLYVMRMPALVAWLAEFVNGPAALGRQATLRRYRARWMRSGHAQPALAEGRMATSARRGAAHAAAPAEDAPAARPLPVHEAPGGPRTNVLCVLGAAADYAHIVPIVQRLASDVRFRTRLCVAAPAASQGAQLLRKCTAGTDAELQVVPCGMDPAELVSTIGGMKREFSAFQPQLILTYGDSPGVLATALMAHYQRVPMARLVRSSRPDGHDELGAHIVRLLSDRRIPAVEGEGSGTPAPEGRAEPAEEGGGSILESLLELSRQPPGAGAPPTLRPARALPGNARGSVSARAETN